MKKILKIILLAILAVIIILAVYLFVGKAKPADKIEWGVTFSKRYAIDLGLDWQKTFSAILDDLKTKRIRIIAYWDEVENEEGKYDFKDLEWQLLEIERHNGEAIFALGRRMPRWPECFEPEWAQNLSEEKKQEKILDFLSETIKYFKNRPSIKIWQIENEPFLGTFGECPKLDKKFLNKEIALARYLDYRKPIMITESGEFSTWIGGARRADILGTSVYRKVYGKLGYVTYPIPPIFYQRKVNLIKLLFDLDEVIAIEVQAEPWGHKPTQEMTNEEQDISMSIEKFNDILEYIHKAGFNKAYLWGVEWWYWRKINGDDRFWNRAKELF
ncbi:MAG TPA: glycoside hydrolase family 2 TIM barrel-domain containing protein [Candidatus Paceibacterota bacterium]|nr:glycoside hydrolase family 2 TIM barrel-domain containing protein [Candidatus Paceibacterota bacterium]